MEERTERLIQFLSNLELHVYDYTFKSIEILVFMDFHDLKEFQEILGEEYFDDGIEVNLCYTYIVYNLVELLERGDEDINDYKEVFDDEQWEAIINSEEYKRWQ